MSGSTGRVFARPLPAARRRLLALWPLSGVAILAGWLLWGERLARELASSSMLSPGAASLTLAFVLLVAWIAAWALLAGAQRRRFGAAELGRTDALFEQVGEDGLAWRVRRADISGWDVTPHGVIVHASRRVRARDGREFVGAHLFPYVQPLLVPTDDPADTEAVVQWLVGRDAPETESL